MDLFQLRLLSHSLTVCRNVMKGELYQSIQNTLDALQEDAFCFCTAYARMTALIFEQGSIGQALFAELACDENVLTDNVHKQVPDYILLGADADIKILSVLSSLSPGTLKAAAQTKYRSESAAISALPNFPLGEGLPLDSGSSLLKLYKTQGYGFFARGSAFAVENGSLRVISPPEVTLADLKGYQRQKQAILENTRGFLRGEEANNILLYGDKGCGKSSTVKAVARHFAGEGLKIIAFQAKEVASFGKIYSQLENSPFRFILYMDDLSFDKETAEFVALKAFMEGGMTEKTKNALVYATSNRRHMIKETFSDRQGDDVHIRETLETQTSLSDRFGMEILFTVPDKQEYLEIVDALAAEQEILMAQEELHSQAEAFAIRKNGRSPRTARQFLNTLQARQNGV